jgi:uncharacterized protein (TIGR02466 family)
MFRSVPLFPTMLWQSMVPEAPLINAGLARRILEMRESLAGCNKSLRTGWQSPRDFLKSDDQVSQVLLRHLDQAVNQAAADAMALKGEEAEGLRVAYRLTSWANVADSCQPNLIHAHPNTSWAAVYYIQCPPPKPDDPAGCLVFMDPRNNADILNLPPGQTLMVQPHAGLMVLFPSWLRHEVWPHEDTQPRISLACNITVERIRQTAGERQVSQ